MRVPPQESPSNPKFPNPVLNPTSDKQEQDSAKVDVIPAKPLATNTEPISPVKAQKMPQENTHPTVTPFSPAKTVTQPPTPCLPKFCTDCGEKFKTERQKFCGECGGKREDM